MKNALKSSVKYKSKILIIDDERDFRWLFSNILGEYGHDVISSRSGKDGLDKVRKYKPDIVFLDLKLPDKDGIQVLKAIKKIGSDIIVIMVTAYDTIQTAVEAMKLGAYDYIPKPVPDERIKIIVDKALETQTLTREVEALKSGGAVLNDIIGQSEPMQKLFKLIKTAAANDISVMLRGKSGTGKELATRAIHSLSGRKDKPFVPVDCATLPETLVESELFGYEKGAFTGADSLKIGKFETAQGGTIFLDEIGNLTLHVQTKLLRVLQERKIERLGGYAPIQVDVRIITATNIDLETAVKKGEFRDDLYYRLNVFEIELPPLQERGDDIIILAHHFLNKFNKDMGKNIKGFSEEVISLFKRYHWPGNVRELENTVKSSIILAKDKILAEHLPFCIKKSMESGIKRDSSTAAESESLNLKRNLDGIPLKEVKKNIIEDTERHLIEKTLNETNWNKKKAANILDIDYKSLYTKVKKYGIKR